MISIDHLAGAVRDDHWFGVVERENLASALREIAADIEGGRLVPQMVRTDSAARVDDFRMHRIEIELGEIRASAAAPGTAPESVAGGAAVGDPVAVDG